MARYAICVFVINEGERVRAQLNRMKSICAGLVDVVVADGGSTDGSLDSAFLEGAGVTALLVKTGPGRLSAQMRMGLAWCLSRGYEGCLTIDGNGKDGLEAIPRLVQLLEEGWDHVQGSRYLAGGHHENTPWLRHWGVQLVHAPLISLAARFRYTDTTNGFRAYSRRLLEDPRVQPFRDCFMGYELHYYLAIRAARLGFRCCETPVSRVYPAHGKTPTKISPLRGNLLVLKTLLLTCLGGYDPPSGCPER
ncbi:MAG: glycosyltransferase family 2 protein [Verrucomicrobiia bacterium]